MSTQRTVDSLEVQIAAVKAKVLYHETEARVQQSVLADLEEDLAAVKRAAEVIGRVERQERAEAQCP
ncbi:MAG: hypothetical protein IT337_16895 [Thermomicrobiales bacterium]|nr:hypothetical protein [Thermomicrobiales bacterium]